MRVYVQMTKDFQVNVMKEGKNRVIYPKGEKYFMNDDQAQRLIDDGFAKKLKMPPRADQTTIT